MAARPHKERAARGCQCPGCIVARAKNTEGKRRQSSKRPCSIDYRLVKTREKTESATAYLEDGASYAEAARTVGVGEKTLRRHIPGFEGNSKVVNSVMSAIKHRPDLLALHREIWQGGTYVEV